jgi:hypothetical protein
MVHPSSEIICNPLRHVLQSPWTFASSYQGSSEQVSGAEAPLILQTLSAVGAEALTYQSCPFKTGRIQSFIKYGFHQIRIKLSLFVHEQAVK